MSQNSPLQTPSQVPQRVRGPGTCLCFPVSSWRNFKDQPCIPSAGSQTMGWEKGMVKYFCFKVPKSWLGSKRGPHPCQASVLWAMPPTPEPLFCLRQGLILYPQAGLQLVAMLLPQYCFLSTESRHEPSHRATAISDLSAFLSLGAAGDAGQRWRHGLLACPVR